MRNKTKLFTLLTIMITLLSALSFGGCAKDYYAFQGSTIIEMPQEEIGGFCEFEAYSSYSKFKKSDLAKKSVALNRPLKDDRYNRNYFDDKNLLVVKFNRNESGREYFVKDVNFSSTVCEVELFNRSNGTLAEEATYYCFIETANDVDSVTQISLSITELDYEITGAAEYINSKNKLYLIEGKQNAISSYALRSSQGLSEFAILDNLPTNYFRYRMLEKENGFYDAHDQLLIIVPSSSIMHWSVVVEHTSITLYSFSSSNYGFGGEGIISYHLLLAVSVPKGAEYNMVTCNMLYEYLDNKQNENITYSINLTRTEISDDIVKYEGQID